MFQDGCHSRQSDEGARQAEDAFYGKYKFLDRTKHAVDVGQFSQAFKSTNPALAQDDLLAMVAAAIQGKHGLVMPTAAPGAPPAPQQPAIPSFVPARPGTAVRVTPEAEGPYAGLGRDHD